MKMINLKYLIGLLVLLIGLSSCYKESNWLADNAELTGNHYPIVQSTSIDNDSYAAGETVKVTCHYWSIDEVEQLELYTAVNGGDETLYASMPYVHNYDPETRTDVTNFDYVVPGETAGSEIMLRVVVVTTAGLTSADEEITQNNGFDVASFTVTD
jgi:hypothetical protein